MLNLANGDVIEDQLNAFAFVLTGLARLADDCDTLDESVQDAPARSGRSPHRRKTEPAHYKFQDYVKHPNRSRRSAG